LEQTRPAKDRRPRCGERRQAIRIGHDGICVSKRRARNKQELPIDSVRRQSLRDIQEIGHGIEQSERTTYDRRALLSHCIGEANARCKVVLAIRDVAGLGKRGVANRRLGQLLEIPAYAVVEREATGGAELILSEYGICGNCERSGALPERLQIKLEVAWGSVLDVVSPPTSFR